MRVIVAEAELKELVNPHQDDQTNQNIDRLENEGDLTVLKG
jgi:hypothetical protein